MEKEFRFDVKKTQEHLERIFPDEIIRNSFLDAIGKCAKLASKLNNANWNVNLSNDFVRVNCGNRYILNIRAERVRVMCWRDSFLELEKDFINDFLKNVSLHKEDTKELMSSTHEPRTFEEIESIPSKILWHNSLQFNVNPTLFAEKYAEKLMPSILDFCRDCISYSAIMPQMQQAHSPGVIELINQELGTNIPQPEYTREAKTHNKLWQKIYDESRWTRSDWHDKYFETVQIIQRNVENVHWSDECIYRMFKSSGNGISAVNWGLKNEHYEAIKENWSFYEPILNRIFHERTISQETYRLLLDKTQEITGVNYNLIVNRVVCGLLPGMLTTTPKEELFYERLNLVKEHFPEIPQIMGEWLEDNLAFVAYCKEQVDFIEEHHASGFIYDLYDYCISPQGDTQMNSYQKKLDEIRRILERNRNVILTGAPGTGKTFMAKTVAAGLILGRAISDCDKDLTEEEKKQVEAQTGFVQFHPSYDYTDFVEGLRPVQDDVSGHIGFERRDGVFKEFCARALKEGRRENDSIIDNFEECWKRLVEELNENNFVSIPLLSGKGDFRVELNEYGTGLANRTYENDDYQKGNWIQGKSKFFSREQLYNIYQGLPGTPAGGHDNYRKAVVEYMKKNLGLLEYTKSEITERIPLKTFVFIIDEINRGEVAKIFGELFFCVDPGYRGEKGRVKTQYQNLVAGGEFQKGFFIPENVCIIGTMNDIDRSVESMDFAFRRRFAWVEVKADDTVDMLGPQYDETGKLIAGRLEMELADEARRRMTRLNNAIWNEEKKEGIEGLSAAYHIGASYFLKLQAHDGDFSKLWECHIKGLLQEYLRGNPQAQEEMETLQAAYEGIPSDKHAGTEQR